MDMELQIGKQSTLGQALTKGKWRQSVSPDRSAEQAAAPEMVEEMQSH